MKYCKVCYQATIKLQQSADIFVKVNKILNTESAKNLYLTLIWTIIHKEQIL